MRENHTSGGHKTQDFKGHITLVPTVMLILIVARVGVWIE